MLLAWNRPFRVSDEMNHQLLRPPEPVPRLDLEPRIVGHVDPNAN